MVDTIPPGNGQDDATDRIFFGPDTPRSRDHDALPKAYFRTLLFSTSKRGRVVESMRVALLRNETHQNFNIWVTRGGNAGVTGEASPSFQFCASLGVWSRLGSGDKIVGGQIRREADDYNDSRTERKTQDAGDTRRQGVDGELRGYEEGRPPTQRGPRYKSLDPRERSLFDADENDAVAETSARDRDRLECERLTAQMNAPLTREEQLQKLKRSKDKPQTSFLPYVLLQRFELG